LHFIKGGKNQQWDGGGANWKKGEKRPDGVVPLSKGLEHYSKKLWGRLFRSALGRREEEEKNGGSGKNKRDCKISSSLEEKKGFDGAGHKTKHYGWHNHAKAKISH